MDIEKLGTILSKEKSTGALQELPGDFCEEVKNYLESLEGEKREADGRWSEHVEDEIRSARGKVEDIINRRIGKIVKLASSGLKPTPKGMLKEEERIFEAVKSHVDAGKERLIALMLGEEESEREVKRGERSAQKEPSEHGLKTVEAPPPSAPGSTEELHMVRILEDIPTFMGIDGKIYRVKKEDVIMLPKTNAELLCKRGVAVRFEGKKKKILEVSAER
jgi:DNA replication factor GINS